jgi:hypothetical protein
MGRLGVSAGAIILSALSFCGAAQAANTTSSWPSIALVAPSAADRVSEAKSGAEAPPCTRKIKVVYSGYGEADRAGCTTAAAADNTTQR